LKPSRVPVVAGTTFVSLLSTVSMLTQEIAAKLSKIICTRVGCCQPQRDA
jgi:hypothetical protein